jgi:hypothetical protein
MKFHWLFILLIPFAALIVAWIGIARDEREQTVFLERIAETLERTRTIPLETEHAIQDTLASIRQRATPANDQLEMRRKHAIERIEAAISGREIARTSGIVSRDLFVREGPAE